MARCYECNRFVPYGDADIEVENEELDYTKVTVNLRVALPCAECGVELREALMEVEIDVDHAHECRNDRFVDTGDDPFTLESVEATFIERLQDKTKTGKKIKNARYMKKFYGAEVAVSIKCASCWDTFEASDQVEEQASAFEEV